MEDDITASVVVPAGALKNSPKRDRQPPLKFVKNCEQRLFQRPDDAIHRGYDKQTEADFARPGQFFFQLRAAHAEGRARAGRGFHRLLSVHRADAGVDPRSRRRTAAAGYFVSRPRIRASWTASRARTRATCRCGPTCSTRAKPISRKCPRACAAACRPASLCTIAGERRAAGPPQQSARTGHPLARGVQSDSLLGAAGAVHGVHLQHDRQIAVHHRRRLGRRADQRAVQRAAADH